MPTVRRARVPTLCSVFLLASLAGPAHAETLVKFERIMKRISMPETIRISSELRLFIDAMLQVSPTFRRQYERIVAAPKLIINARTNMTFMQRPFRARSSMRRYDSGLLVVSMDIEPGVGQGEWIAHEFEHVIEQLDGLTLPAMASRGNRDTWFSSDQMVETTRATRVGRVVRAEMRGRNGYSDKFVN